MAAATDSKRGFDGLAVVCVALAAIFFVIALALFLQGGWQAARALEVEAKVLTPPNTDKADALAAQQAVLDGGYRWINQDAGTVGVPVERAVELIVERGGELRPAGTR